jgi:hypothetical protein
MTKGVEMALFSEYEKPGLDAAYVNEEEEWWHEIARKYIPPGRQREFGEERMAHVHERAMATNKAVFCVKETWGKDEAGPAVCAHKWVHLRARARSIWHEPVMGSAFQPGYVEKVEDDIFFCERCLERRVVSEPLMGFG